jgi:hypothetical protein
VPATFTVAGFVAFINAPPFHVRVFPALVPVKVDVNTEHVILPELVAVTVGVIIFEVIVTELVFEQPPPSVTVSE